MGDNVCTPMTVVSCFVSGACKPFASRVVLPKGRLS